MLLVGCAACEKPLTKPAEEQKSQPYVDQKNEELKALKVDLEATIGDRPADLEKAVVESSQD